MRKCSPFKMIKWEVLGQSSDFNSVINRLPVVILFHFPSHRVTYCYFGESTQAKTEISHNWFITCPLISLEWQYPCSFTQHPVKLPWPPDSEAHLLFDQPYIYLGYTDQYNSYLFIMNIHQSKLSNVKMYVASMITPGNFFSLLAIKILPDIANWPSRRFQLVCVPFHYTRTRTVHSFGGSVSAVLK